MSKKSTLALSLGASAFLGFVPQSFAQALLSLDVDERSTPVVTASGFTSFLMSDTGNAIQTTPTVRTFGGVTVTLSGIGAGYDDRLRATPVNNGAFTLSDIYRDVIFSRDSSGTGGLDIDLTGLTPNQQYAISVFSFDSGSSGTRVSDWSANGTLVKDNYTFDGRVLPTDNSTYRIDFTTTASSSGEVLISGRRDVTSVDAAATPAPSFGVFLNGLTVTSVPEPGVMALFGLGGLFVLARKRR